MKRPKSDLSEAETDISPATTLAADIELAEGSWEDIATAPRDGTMIEYDPGRFTRFRRTRRRQDNRWAEVEYWINCFTGEEIHPVRWRAPQGFNQPGMVRV